MNLIVKRVTELKELQGIRQLQEDNLKKNLASGEAEKEGFVSAEYTLEFLQRMHNACPSIIAKDGDAIAGYALIAVQSIKQHHALLEDLFNVIDATMYKGATLKNTNYVVVGQLCIAKNYRGIGLVKKLYDFYKKELCNQFNYAITDVAQDNPRSLKAHQKAGFEVIETLSYGGIDWFVILWDWRK